MPKLLIFAPCEKTIISQEENLPSLIGVLSKIRFGVPQSAEPGLRSGADVAPLSWSVFLLWERAAGDDRPFTQSFEILAPTGEVLLRQEQTFEMALEQYRHVINLPGFPVGGAGTYELRLSLDDERLASYHIDVDFTMADAPTNN